MKIVLLPGLDGTGLLFKPLLEQEPAQFDSIVVHYPTDQPSTYPELSRYVLEQLPREEAFLLLAESFSGPLALEIAAKRIKNLLGVVLAASFAQSPVPRWIQAVPLQGLQLLPLTSRMMHTVLLGKQANMEMYQLLAQVIRGVPTKILAYRIQEVLKVDAMAALSSLEVPLLYLQATQDKLIRKSSVRRMRRVQPMMEVVEVVGPHLVLQVNPKRSWQVISDFVQKLA